MRSEEEMKELLKEMKENLLGKEISLLDLDNESETILNTSESLYENFSETIKNKSFAYILGYSNELGEQAIVVEFDIIGEYYEEKLLDDEDYKYAILVKVTNIFEL